MSYSYKERQTINAALQAGRKAASKPERTLTEAEFQELEALAANCPMVPLKVVRRAAKLRDELAGLLQTPTAIKAGRSHPPAASNRASQGQASELKPSRRT